MQTLAAVMTGGGTSAIATVAVYGPQACDILARVFIRCGAKPVDFQVGSIQIGTLYDGSRPIDQIALGCEGRDQLALHSHGNPLIVKATMALLKRHGITLTTPQDIKARQLAAANLSPCQLEAHLALACCATLVGARLLHHQTQQGLDAWAQKNHNTLEALHTQCRTILHQSRIARTILNGITVVLIGPPNSGKSTLLNSLSGQDAAIVTDIGGTTRDWVEAHCRTDNLLMRLVDTAGLNTALQQDLLDFEFQQRTLAILNQADLILLVLDIAQPATQIECSWLSHLPDCPCLTVLNKSDLPSQLDPKDLGLDPTKAISISAKHETGLNDLLSQIEDTLGIKDFQIAQPLCVTSRQQACLERILSVQTLAQCKTAS